MAAGADIPPPQFSGHIWKKSPSALRFGTHQRRFVVLDCGKLSWWLSSQDAENDEMLSPKTVSSTHSFMSTASSKSSPRRGSKLDTISKQEQRYIDFAENPCEVVADEGNDVKFTLRPKYRHWNRGSFTGVSAGRTFDFDASDSEHTRTAWLAAMESHLRYGEGCRGASAICGKSALGHSVCNIVLLGPPGAGKGTQCNYLVQRYGCIHLSIGSILRDQVKLGTDLGKDVLSYTNGGRPIPDDMVMNAVRNRLHQPDVSDRGCVLDGFPSTEYQAQALAGILSIKFVLVVDIPDDAVAERIVHRRVDPKTGNIYNLNQRPPPAEVVSRLRCRHDDTVDIAHQRLQVYRDHLDSILGKFGSGVHVFESGTRTPLELFGCIVGCLDSGAMQVADVKVDDTFANDGMSLEQPRVFYSRHDLCKEGDVVVCYRRGDHWMRQGVVTDVNAQVSRGSKMDASRQGEQHSVVTISDDRGDAFQSWSSYLVPVSKMERSLLCSTADLECSAFCQLFAPAAITFRDIAPVPREEARRSLKIWLQNLQDDFGGTSQISEFLLEEVLAAFDSQHDASQLVARTIASGERPHSLYYTALNAILRRDDEASLTSAMPLIQYVVHHLLYTDRGARRLHAGGQCWAHDTQQPSPSIMLKIQQALAHGGIVRFQQFQSASGSQAKAAKSCPGFTWAIEIPEGFWGACEIRSPRNAAEVELIFAPYSAFRVTSLSSDGCNLVAADLSSEVGDKAERHMDFCEYLPAAL